MFADQGRGRTDVADIAVLEDERAVTDERIADRSDECGAEERFHAGRDGDRDGVRMETFGKSRPMVAEATTPRSDMQCRKVSQRSQRQMPNDSPFTAPDLP